MSNTATAAESTAQARVRETGWQPPAWTPTFTGTNTGPGALRRLEVSSHIPTSSAAPADR